MRRCEALRHHPGVPERSTVLLPIANRRSYVGKILSICIGLAFRALAAVHTNYSHQRPPSLPLRSKELRRLGERRSATPFADTAGRTERYLVYTGLLNITSFPDSFCLCARIYSRTSQSFWTLHQPPPSLRGQPLYTATYKGFGLKNVYYL